MKRATYIDADGWYAHGDDMCWGWNGAVGEFRCRGKDIDRLAAYEDTGLEPEEIIELKFRMEGLEK